MGEYDKYMKNLPVIPDVAVKILSMAEDNIDISFSELEEIIKIDAALTSKVLKVANSALYARQNQISSLNRAISLLGFKTIKSLVLILSAASAFKVEGQLPFYREFWKNSLLTAFYSKEIALELFNKSLAEDVFLSGLIHRIGQIALYRHDPDYYSGVINHKSSNDLSIMESDYYGVDHRTLGSAILESWSFPKIFIDVAREYGSTNIISQFKKEVIIVSLADLMTKESLNSDFNIEEETLEESRWLEALGITYGVFSSAKENIIKKLIDDEEYKECEDIFNNL